MSSHRRGAGDWRPRNRPSPAVLLRPLTGLDRSPGAGRDVVNVVNRTPEEWPTGHVTPVTPPSGAVATEPIPDNARAVLVADPSTRTVPRSRALAGRHAAPASARVSSRVLLAILAVQAVLSLRLMLSNTAFQDEALYLWAGRMEWAHWLHGAPVPELVTWFSGSPAIYPPIGALAASIGGLAAARALSLVFMLATNTFLWGTATILFGRRAAFCATALFAVLANTQFLGAFATYDAMAIMLIAFSTWVAVVSVSRGRWAQLVLLTTSASALALADATKYAATLFDPVVLAVVVLAAGQLRGRRASVRAGLIMSGALLTSLAGGVLFAGAAYWQGITSTTLDRPAASASTSVILEQSFVWTSLVIVLSALGIVLARRDGRMVTALVATLFLAALLVPAEQIHVHTTISLQKHVDYGAWFAVIAAGYAIARVSQLDKGVGWVPVMLLPIIAFTVSSSLGQASELFQGWPNSAPLMSALRPVLKQDHGLVLAEGDEYPVILDDLGNEVSFDRLQSTYQFTYTDPRSGRRIGMPASFADAIKHDYFGVIALDYAGGRPEVDDTIAKSAEASPDCRESLNERYMQLHVRRTFTVWICRPSPVKS
jgi:Dolichyl-phosphate-mannose-protein mannosyltransferase